MDGIKIKSDPKFTSEIDEIMDENPEFDTEEIIEKLEEKFKDDKNFKEYFHRRRYFHTLHCRKHGFLKKTRYRATAEVYKSQHLRNVFYIPNHHKIVYILKHEP